MEISSKISHYIINLLNTAVEERKMHDAKVQDAKKTLSIVIPCYNEESGITHLAEKLHLAVEKLRQAYSVELVFVDDGSTDRTNELLYRYFGNDPRNKIVRHEKNKNLGAALRTGFAQCTGDYIAALDSDCTYDPSLLMPLLQLLDEQTDITTVSPYHPHGKVSNVPGYRVFLSKSASFLYRVLLDWNLYTYTAMVRVYKKEVIRNTPFERDNFLGVTELLVNAMLKGYKVRELPAELQVRKFGVSKMKMLPVKVIKDHLSLMGSIVKHRITGIAKQ